MDTANEIKKLRTDMGMNRKEFCDYYNIPYRTVTDWEAGKRKMPEYVLELMEFKAKVEQLKSPTHEKYDIKEDFCYECER